MSYMWSERNAKSQIGFCNNASANFETAGGDLNFATGIYFLMRMRNTIPRGATINSAVLKYQVIAKNAGTAQTVYTSFRAHASGDSPTLVPGAPQANRPWTAARVEWNYAWPVNPPGDVIATVDVAPIVNEIIARSDYQPGGFITFMMFTDNENGSDMGIRANNDFAMTVQLHVDYTENYRDLKCDINIINNPHNESMPAIDTTPLPFWGQNPFYGAMVDEANQGTIARDTSFTRLPGVATMRFTTGTPPDAAQASKGTGPYTAVIKLDHIPYIFAGWIYIPSAITATVRVGDPYLGNVNSDVTQRDQWVPFCTAPTTTGPPSANRGVFWPAIRILGPFQAGWQFWVSEPTIMESSFRQMPFNGLTPDIKDPGLVTLIDHKYVGSGQAAVREWTPRTAIVRGGAVKRVRRFTKRADGILQVEEPIKGGPVSTAMSSAQIQNYPAGKTIAEL